MMPWIDDELSRIDPDSATRQILERAVTLAEPLDEFFDILRDSGRLAGVPEDKLTQSIILFIADCRAAINKLFDRLERDSTKLNHRET